MANFRGIGDDTQDVIKEQNRMAIAANELSQRKRENKDKVQLEREQMGARKEEVAARTAEDARQFDATQQARAGEFDQEHQLRVEEGKRNSERFKMAKTEWEAQEAKRQESLKLQEGAFSDLLRATAFSPAPPPSFIRRFNEQAGLVEGDEGFLRGMMQLRDANGHSSGIGYTTTGPDGKDVRHVVPPTMFWAAMGKYSPEDQKMLSEAYAKQYDVNDPMNRERVRQMEAYAKYYEAGGAAGAKAPVFPAEQEKALAAEQTRLEASLTDKTMLRDDVETTKAKIARIAGEREKLLGVAAPSPTVSAAAPKSAANSTSVQVSNGSIIVTENGVAKSRPDTPALRAALRKLGYDL